MAKKAQESKATAVTDAIKMKNKAMHRLFSELSWSRFGDLVLFDAKVPFK